jgi:hypothetical protein
MSAESARKKKKRAGAQPHRRKSRDFRRPGASTLPLSRGGCPASRWRHVRENAVRGEGVVMLGRTVPLWGSHCSPPLQPPSRQALGPPFTVKLQPRRP